MLLLLLVKVVPGGGIEPPTRGFSIRSQEWGEWAIGRVDHGQPVSLPTSCFVRNVNPGRWHICVCNTQRFAFSIADLSVSLVKSVGTRHVDRDRRELPCARLKEVTVGFPRNAAIKLGILDLEAGGNPARL